MKKVRRKIRLRLSRCLHDTTGESGGTARSVDALSEYRLCQGYGQGEQNRQDLRQGDDAQEQVLPQAIDRRRGRQCGEKGVVTGVNRGKVYFNSWSMNVKIEGKNVVRHMDLTTHNHASLPGNSLPTHYIANSYSKDDALVDCILDLCATDPEIVEKAADKLTIYSRNPKRVEVLEYDGTKWRTIKKGTPPGTAGRKTKTIWINHREDCSQTKDTLYHEVHHTRQDPKMSSRDMEIDAYMQTEQWLIDRGIPGTEAFRSETTDGRTIPNRKEIEQHVDRNYGYSSTTPRIVRTENGGKTVVFRGEKNGQHALMIRFYILLRDRSSINVAFHRRSYSVPDIRIENQTDAARHKTYLLYTIIMFY